MSHVLLQGDPIVCKACGFDYTHYDRVIMAARPFGEDGIVELISVDSKGIVGRMLPEDEEKYKWILSTRRHSIWLIGTCENCDSRTAATFTQYKGKTYLNVVTDAELEI
jgi:hypothetical protein